MRSTASVWRWPARPGVRAVPMAELFGQLGFTVGDQAHPGGVYHAIRHSELIGRSSRRPGSTIVTCTKTSAGDCCPGCTWPRQRQPGTRDHCTHPPGRDDQRHRLPAQRAHLQAHGTSRKDPSEIRAHAGAPITQPAGSQPVTSPRSHAELTIGNPDGRRITSDPMDHEVPAATPNGGYLRAVAAAAMTHGMEA